MDSLSIFFSTTVKLLALMTPPAVLSAYLSASRTYDDARKKRTVRRTGLAVLIIGLVLFFLGEKLFIIFGFTLDAFRIGAGALLFLSAVTIMNESKNHTNFDPNDDISVVPLAIPLCMGPASIGTVMIIGASAKHFDQKITGALSLVVATACIYTMLLFAEKVEKILGETGLNVLSKLTGLMLAAIAAQVVFTGIHAFLY
jgi:multiple antibiotic resistance protein